MDGKEIELATGQTAVARVTPYLSYRVTHTGWCLEVEGVAPIGVRPKDEKTVVVINLGTVNNDYLG